jgi:hypothetical protein
MISYRVLPSHISGLSKIVVSPWIGGTIGPSLTFGYPYRPTNTDGGVAPAIESNDNLDEFRFRNWIQLFSNLRLVLLTPV